jgi:hypothetical protein
MGNIFCNDIISVKPTKLKSYYYQKYVESFYNLMTVYNEYIMILKKHKQINSDNLKEIYNNTYDANIKLGDAIINESKKFHDLEYYINNMKYMNDIINRYKILRDNALKFGVENFITCPDVLRYIEWFTVHQKV